MGIPSGISCVGNLSRRDEAIGLLRSLPQATLAGDDEVLSLPVPRYGPATSACPRSQRGSCSPYHRRVDEGDPLAGACRLLLYGVTGSGKTTAAARISAATGIAWTSVDDLTWEPGWVAVPAAGESGPRVLRFTSPAALDRWIDSLHPTG